MLNKIFYFLNLKFYYFCISKFNFFYKKQTKLNYNFESIKKKLNNKKIALVGNSPRLLRKLNKIDSFDIVIRINIIPPKKTHRQIGRKCDLLFLQGSGGTHWLLKKNIPKLWLENSSNSYTRYARGEIYHYPLAWEKELARMIKTISPSAGVKSIHFLSKILKNPKITLFGFDHTHRNWYRHNFNKNHDYNKEGKYFQHLVKKYKNIRYSHP